MGGSTGRGQEYFLCVLLCIQIDGKIHIEMGKKEVPVGKRRVSNLILSLVNVRNVWDVQNEYMNMGI